MGVDSHARPAGMGRCFLVSSGRYIWINVFDAISVKEIQVR
jgi:hypothetical protein